jgi:hypothetical protein
MDFGTVLIVIVLAGATAAFIAYVGVGRMYERIGKGGLSLDEPDRPPGPPPGSAAARAEAEAEIRQFVEAKSARREARGEAPLDVDAEVAALTRPHGEVREEKDPGEAGEGSEGEDAALREEVRQLVIASNERRVRRGEPPLDVEAEVDRQLRDLNR